MFIVRKDNEHPNKRQTKDTMGAPEQHAENTKGLKKRDAGQATNIKTIQPTGKQKQ